VPRGERNQDLCPKAKGVQKTCRIHVVLAQSKSHLIDARSRLELIAASMSAFAITRSFTPLSALFLRSLEDRLGLCSSHCGKE
jgi:hypothetical protein